MHIGIAVQHPHAAHPLQRLRIGVPQIARLELELRLEQVGDNLPDIPVLGGRGARANPKAIRLGRAEKLGHLDVDGPEQVGDLDVGRALYERLVDVRRLVPLSRVIPRCFPRAAGVYGVLIAGTDDPRQPFVFGLTFGHPFSVRIPYTLRALFSHVRISYTANATNGTKRYEMNPSPQS